MRKASKRFKVPSHPKVLVPAVGPLKEGDKFTMAGMRRLPDGRIITDCKPGEESVCIAVISREAKT